MRNGWAWVRSGIVMVGLPFSTVSLGVACLDYAGEPTDACETFSDIGAPASGAAAPLGAGSGSGSGATTPAADAPDCGVATGATTGGQGSGSGSATP